MLFYIAILCPAVISVAVLQFRNKELKLKSIKTVIEYLINLVINVFATSLLVCTLLGSDVRIDSFVSLSFFIKYVVIALTLAVVIPYVWIIIKTYIKIELVIEDYEKDKK